MVGSRRVGAAPAVHLSMLAAQLAAAEAIRGEGACTALKQSQLHMSTKTFQHSI
jgi:hypothetical protein